jgi:hypothetical protein
VLQAGLFLAAYFGIAVPVLGLGVASQLVSAQDVPPGFAGVLAAAASRALAGRAAAAGRHPPAPSPPGRRKPRRPPAGNSGERHDALYTRLAVQFYQGRNLP